MKTIIALGCVVCLAIPAHGEVQQKRIVTNSIIAVPVAVPVATYAPVQYQNQAVPYTDPPVSERELLIRDLAKALAQELRGEAPQKQLAPVTMFAKKCASCHSKPNPDGRPVFAALGTLNGDQLDDCMDTVLNDKMPKGGHLSPQDAGTLLKEISAAKKAIRQKQSEALPRRPQEEASPPVKPSDRADVPPEPTE